MTRRERHIRIVENFGPHSQSTAYHLTQLQAKLGLGAFTDAAIRELATRLVSSRARQNKYNQERRKLLAQRAA